MTNMLALQDLQGYTESEIIDHLTQEYGDGDGSYLENKEVLIAYESVGSWGCDSSSFFLLRDKISGELFEIHGSHCSCYGFEGQLELEPSSVSSLKYRDREGSIFCTGGYDGDDENNKQRVSEFIKRL